MAIKVRMAADVDKGTLPYPCSQCDERPALYAVQRDAGEVEYLCSDHLEVRAAEDEELRIAAKLPLPE
jgi:hypothetical protein